MYLFMKQGLELCLVPYKAQTQTRRRILEKFLRLIWLTEDDNHSAVELRTAGDA
jgi:hypothetical protein